MATLDQRQYLADFYKLASIKMALGRKKADIYEKLHLEMCAPYDCYVNGVYRQSTKGKMFHFRKRYKAQSVFNILNLKPCYAA